MSAVNFGLALLLQTSIFATHVAGVAQYRINFISNIHNRVTLGCLNIRDGVNRIPTPVFFRNDEQINQEPVSNFVYAFNLNRENEGRYSCGELRDGRVIRDDSGEGIMELIPTPNDNDATIMAREFLVNIGDTAIIYCPVVPGSLASRYSVRWYNASDQSQIFVQRIANFNMSVNGRYSLNQQDFSLSIDQVRQSDAASQYVCFVSVNINSRDHIYERSRRINQTLNVFEAPAFVVSPKPVTIASNMAENATFSCKVRSSPRPSTIYWSHGTSIGVILNSRNGHDSSSYAISTSTIATAGGHQVSSELTVLGLSSRHTGVVSCRVTYDDPLEEGLEQVAEAALAVISEPSDIIHHQADRGGFLFQIRTVSKLLVPVRADIYYIDADTGAEERSLQSEFFFNTTTLWVFRDKAPFPRFRMAVRMVHGNEATVGPFRNSSEVIERSRTNKELVLMASGAGVLALWIVSLLVLVPIVVYYAVDKKHLSNERDRLNKIVEEQNKMKSDGSSESKNKRTICERILARVCCCFNVERHTLYKKNEGVSERFAQVYLKNFEDLLKFGLSDKTIREKLLINRYRDKKWQVEIRPHSESGSQENGTS